MESLTAMRQSEDENNVQLVDFSLQITSSKISHAG
jgi:hypothetical protein